MLHDHWTPASKPLSLLKIPSQRKSTVKTIKWSQKTGVQRKDFAALVMERMASRKSTSSLDRKFPSERINSNRSLEIRQPDRLETGFGAPGLRPRPKGCGSCHPAPVVTAPDSYSTGAFEAGLWSIRDDGLLRHISRRGRRRLPRRRAHSSTLPS